MSYSEAYSFDASDADVLVKSADGETFKLHHANLRTHSGEYERFFANKPSPIQLEEKGRILRVLFQFIYPTRQPDVENMDFSLTADIAEAVEKYKIFSAMTICGFHLRQVLPQHADRIMGHALLYNYPNLITQASTLLARAPLSSVIEKIPAPYILSWVKYHEAWSSVFEEALEAVQNRTAPWQQTGTLVQAQPYSAFGSFSTSQTNAFSARPSSNSFWATPPTQDLASNTTNGNIASNAFTRANANPSSSGIFGSGAVTMAQNAPSCFPDPPTFAASNGPVISAFPAVQATFGTTSRSSTPAASSQPEDTEQLSQFFAYRSGSRRSGRRGSGGANKSATTKVEPDTNENDNLAIQAASASSQNSAAAVGAFGRNTAFTNGFASLATSSRAPSFSSAGHPTFGYPCHGCYFIAFQDIQRIKALKTVDEVLKALMDTNVIPQDGPFTNCECRRFSDYVSFMRTKMLQKAEAIPSFGEFVSQYTITA